MGVEASPEQQVAEKAAAVETAALTPEATTGFLAAPPGWQKKLALRKGGTPKRRDVFFVAPTGEEIKSKTHLERYLKKNPDGPLLTDFDWSTGETPRRSERLTTKTKVSPTSAEAEPPKKRSKKKTPSKDSKEDEETGRTPSEKETPVKDYEGVEEAVAKLFETNEVENVVSKQSEEAEAEKESKEDEGTDNNAVKSVEIETTVSKQLEKPESVIEEVKEDATVVEHGQDLKEAEKIEIDHTKEEASKEVTKEDVDTEMVDAAAVSPDVEEATAVKDHLKMSEEVTADDKQGINGDFKLEQSIKVEAAVEVVAEGTSKEVELVEGKKDTVVDGHQEAINGVFSAAEFPREEEHAERMSTESEHQKPEINAYYGVTKPQETHPAEVGVSS